MDGSGSVRSVGPPAPAMGGMDGGAAACGPPLASGTMGGGPGICGIPDGIAGACTAWSAPAMPGGAPDGPVAKRVCGRLEFMAAKR